MLRTRFLKKNPIWQKSRFHWQQPPSSCVARANSSTWLQLDLLIVPCHRRPYLLRCVAVTVLVIILFNLTYRMKFQLTVLLIVSFLLLVSSFSFTQQQQQQRARRSLSTRGRSYSLHSWQLYSSFYRDDEDDDEEDEIDADSLGDWRDFRRNLAAGMSDNDSTITTSNKRGSAENEKVLRSQNEVLANEYKMGVWAHETSTVRCRRMELLMKHEYVN